MEWETPYALWDELYEYLYGEDVEWALRQQLEIQMIVDKYTTAAFRFDKAAALAQLSPEELDRYHRYIGE